MKWSSRWIGDRNGEKQWYTYKKNVVVFWWLKVHYDRLKYMLYRHSNTVHLKINAITYALKLWSIYACVRTAQVSALGALFRKWQWYSHSIDCQKSWFNRFNPVFNPNAHKICHHQVWKWQNVIMNNYLFRDRPVTIPLTQLCPSYYLSDCDFVCVVVMAYW